MDLQTLKSQLTRRVCETAELGCALTWEAGASLLSCQLAPLGLAGHSLPLVPSPWGKRGRGPVPILFIHGIFHNPTAFTYLRQRLAWEGWQSFEEINLFTTMRSIHRNALAVASRVEWMRRKYSVPKIDMVAHSMGGLIARYYLQALQGEGAVRKLVTLGTPHQGTDWSRYSPLPHLKELRPESKTIRLLKEAPYPRHTEALAIAGNLDLFMTPRGCHWWNGVRNVLLKGVGHAGLLFSNRAARLLVEELGTASDPETESCPGEL